MAEGPLPATGVESNVLLFISAMLLVLGSICIVASKVATKKVINVAKNVNCFEESKIYNLGNRRKSVSSMNVAMKLRMKVANSKGGRLVNCMSIPGNN